MKHIITTFLLASLMTACAGKTPMVKPAYMKGRQCVTWQRTTCRGVSGADYACYACRSGDSEIEPN